MKSIKELEKVVKDKQIECVAIIIYGSPDPDALASGFALQYIFDHYGIVSEIFCEKEISLPNNQMLINASDINIKILTDIQKYEYYAVVDCQDKGLAKKVKATPPKTCLVHIDHHKEMKSKALYSDIDTGVGSCSTILCSYLKELDLLKNKKESGQLALALAYGIYSDTNSLFGAVAKDIEMVSYLRSYYDPESLHSLVHVRYTNQTMQVIKKTLDSNKIKGTFSYSGIGYVASEHADSIAIAAEFLISKQSGISNVLVYAIIEDKAGDHIRGCFRTSDSAIDTDKFVKSFISYGSGGGKKTAGGFQEPLGFLQDCKETDKVWELVHSTIEDKINSKVRLAKEEESS